MINFSSWLEEKKKTKESQVTTATSSPIRGANQDQSGYNGKNNVADYTISDETVPDSWEDNSPQKRIATVKKLIKQDQRYGAVHKPHSKIREAVNEIVSGVSGTRITPVNMKTSGHSGTKDTPQIAHSMQHAADARRASLDKSAQQEKDRLEKERIQKQKDRERASDQRDREALQRKKNDSIQ